VAPGLLESHYAPRKRLGLIDLKESRMLSSLAPSLLQFAGPLSVGVLTYGRPLAQATAEWKKVLGAQCAEVKALAEENDPAFAAHQLFRCLRELDSSPQCQVLLCELPPEGEGLLHALRDRLGRAGRSVLARPPDEP
jgi:hypothetical protein